MIEIDLQADVKIERHIVTAYISTAERRYVLPVLMHVQDADGKATTESLSKDLFPGLEPLSQKLLEMCEDEDLIRAAAPRPDAADRQHREYSTTKNGKDAISADRAFVRNPGRIWEIHYVKHEMVSKNWRILTMTYADTWVAGYNPTLPVKDQLEVAWMPSHMREMKGEATTRLLRGAQSRTRDRTEAEGALATQKQETIRIDEIADYGKSSPPDMRASLHWHLDESKTSLKIKMQGGEYDLHPSDSLGYTRVLEHFMSSNHQWDKELKCLHVKFRVYA